MLRGLLRYPSLVDVDVDVDIDVARYYHHPGLTLKSASEQEPERKGKRSRVGRKRKARRKCEKHLSPISSFSSSSSFVPLSFPPHDARESTRSCDGYRFARAQLNPHSLLVGIFTGPGAFKLIARRDVRGQIKNSKEREKLRAGGLCKGPRLSLSLSLSAPSILFFRLPDARPVPPSPSAASRRRH